MELRHLRYFLAVADEGSFTNAAARLHVTQPSLSQQIRQLERMLGAELLLRAKGRRGVGLTDVGRVLEKEARGVLEHVDRSMLLVDRAVARRPSLLRVGVPPWMPPSFVADIADQMVRRLPEVECELEAATSADTLRHLVEGDVDLGLVRLPLDFDDLHHIRVLRQPVGIWLTPGHPLRRYRTVPVERLEGVPLGLFERSASPELVDAVRAAFAERRVSPDWHEVSASDTAVLARMRARGFAHVGPRELPGPVRGMTWRVLRGLPVELETAVAWRGDASDVVRVGVEVIASVASRFSALRLVQTG